MFKPILTRPHLNYSLKDYLFHHNTKAVIGPHFKQTVAGILSVDSFYVR